MHPNTFYSTLFNQSKRDEVFVIMSFASEFEERWRQVIEPCIREDLSLTASRVDYNVSGESVVHDILDGIAHARLVIADITSSLMRDRRSQEWPQRNGNVMWEVGIAHVMRLPDEVLMIRSDSDESLFDLTQFRAFQYDPDNDVDGAREYLARLVKDRLRSIDHTECDYVKRCASALDFAAWNLLNVACREGGIHPPIIRTMGQVMGNMSTIPAIARLLEMGAIKTSYIRITPELLANPDLDKLASETMLRYQATPLGHAIARHVAQRMNLGSAALQPLMEQLSQINSQKNDELTPS